MAARGPARPARLALLGLLAAGTMAGASGCAEEKCSRGDPCDESCPAGQTSMCVVDGICRCVNQAAAGGNGGQGDGGPNGSGGVAPPPEGCALAVAGDLLLNEVMIDGAADGEVDEFIEIVNLANHPVSLVGLKVVSADEGAPADVAPADPTLRWTFVTGCIMGQSAVAVYRKPEIYPTVASSDPLQSVTSTYGGSGLSNTKDFDLRLVSGATQLDRFAGAHSTFREGESANRSPDGLPEGVAARHSEVSSSALKNSPGRCANGGTFEQFCGDAPPPPDAGMNTGGTGGEGGNGSGGMGGQPDPGGGGPGGNVVPPPVCDLLPAPLPPVIINEVLANTNDAQPQEFIEIVNTTDADIPMDGWVFHSTKSSGDFDDRLSIGTGVLPARGAVAVLGSLPPEQWAWDPVPAVMATVTHEAWSLLDSGDPLRLRIADATGADVATLDVPKALNKDGKSANRCHDIDGATLVVHDTLGGVASPGRCVQGGSFSSGCAPPAPGSMP